VKRAKRRAFFPIRVFGSQIIFFILYIIDLIIGQCVKRQLIGKLAGWLFSLNYSNYSPKTFPPLNPT
jgi:hypothetical protein